MALSKEKRDALNLKAEAIKPWVRSKLEDPEIVSLREEIRRYENEKGIWDELAENVENARKMETKDATVKREAEK